MNDFVKLQTSEDDLQLENVSGLTTKKSRGVYKPHQHPAWTLGSSTHTTTTHTPKNVPSLKIRTLTTCKKFYWEPNYLDHLVVGD
ncbi:hypothetical protein IHE45_15G010300 [Dioscorea alata]|uniref:Uncharacterized protein n=1 Tax=Dioscorea alata TaxID=55571 RepID=A0ACB7UJM5_DIOAL|nr:hypothetical protein IHE45_15G010300 [Dioscorea alata]